VNDAQADRGAAGWWGALRRRNRRALIVGFVLCLGCSDERANTTNTEILWDAWGVPHIFASDDEAAFYAFGWAQMRAHGDLIARLYGEARGRAAEYWGEQNLESDRWVRTMGIPDRAREWYRAQSDGFRSCLDAFAAGMNDYARQNPGSIADDVEVVFPVSGEDILAHAQRTLHFTFVSNPEAIETAPGSNAWAIAPSRSASGHALLLQNPHLPWSGLYLFTEAQIHTGSTNIYGAALVGSPVLGIAFNDRLGWSHTVNTIDGADLYELAPAPGGYRFDGEVRPFDEEQQTVRVRGQNGAMREERLVLRRSVHGPVVAERNGKPLALRVSGLDAPGALEQWWDMGQARNLVEFETVLRRLQIPMFNVMYADADGHILYLFGGRVPKRSRGDVDFWAGIVPGDRSDTLWTEVHSYEELPRLVDPKTGWLQNANDPPWTSTFPSELRPADFPAYMSPEFMHLRAQHSAKLLVEDDSISLDELLQYKHSTRMLLFDRVKDDLAAAVRAHGSERARKAMAVLDQWDSRADADRRGAVLFWFWLEAWNKSADGDMATKWDPEKPLSTPDGFASPKAAAQALDAAAREVDSRFGSMDVAYGEVFRLRYEGKDLPANGAPEDSGTFRIVRFEPAEKRMQSTGGDSYYAAVEFSSPLRARVLTAYGSSTQPGSRHRGDQLELFSREEMRPVLRTRKEIEASLEMREALTFESQAQQSSDTALRN
jgi:acyl-homoserine-lactone acylase